MRKGLPLVLVALLAPGLGLGVLACEGDSGGGSSGSAAFDSGVFTSDSGGGGGDGSALDGAQGDGGGDGGAATFTTFHVAMGDNGACAVFPDGRMKCWGAPYTVGAVEPVGDGPGEMGAALPYVAVGKRVKKVRAAQTGGAICIILEDGGARCWGGTNLGQATPGVALASITTNIDFGPGRSVVDIQIGTSHACAILDNGGLTCWGNDGVALGRGNDVSLATPLATPIDVGAGRTAKAVSVGLAFTCAVLDNDRIKCWGRGNNTITDVGNGGQLGNGSTAYIGNDPGEMGDTLAYAKLGNDPGTSAPWKVKKLIASNAFACATLANDRLKCWGQADTSGVLGSGNGSAYGAEIVNDDIPFLDLGKDAKTDLPLTVKDFALGQFHGCALLSNDSIRCWGSDNGFGALGRGDRLTIGDEPGEMGDAMIPVALKPGRKATALYASFGSTCARVDTSTLSCWGRNGQGLLGIGLPNAAPSNAIGDEAAELGAGTVETILE